MTEPMTRVSEQLKPCPFCGASAMLLRSEEALMTGEPDNLYRVSCISKSCGVKTKYWYPADSAVASWNRRVTVVEPRHEMFINLADGIITCTACKWATGNATEANEHMRAHYAGFSPTTKEGGDEA